MIIITKEEQETAHQYSELAWELSSVLAKTTSDYIDFAKRPAILRQFKLIHKEPKISGRTTVDFRHSMADFVRLHITIFHKGTGKIVAQAYKDGEQTSKEILFNADAVDVFALADKIKTTIELGDTAASDEF